MALTPSKMLDLGTKAPEFSLINVIDNTVVELNNINPEKGLIIMFICNHCPYVIHVIDGIIKMANDYKSKGFEFIAINSNDIINYPQDSPEFMKKWARDLDFPFPYLFDESQKVAREYDAACTPDFYIFGQNKKLVYRGQMDDSRPGNEVPVTGHAIREVLEQILNNQKVSSIQKPSLGCGIKWIN